MRNSDPFAPWNDPMHKNDPFAPHNNPMRSDNPFELWNNPMGSERDLNDSDRQSYGLRPTRSREDEIDW